MGYRIIHQVRAVQVIIDAKNEGKFRFKNRSRIFDFGKVFSTREIPFGKNSYLEWQIGYDIPVNKVNEETLDTWGNRTFVGRNNKRKIPFELFDIYQALIESNIIKNSTTNELYDEILNYKIFLDSEFISINTPDDFTINNVDFKRTKINLPTYYYFNEDKTNIEVSIKQQQYASGVQAMIYFCIPILSFSDGKQIIGKTSKEKENLCYIINQRNKQSILNLIRIFGMSSQKHRDDILNILSYLKNA